MTIKELEQLRAALPDDDRAPLAELQQRLADLQQQRRTLDHRLSTARAAQRTLDELGEPFVTWHAHLNEWRPILCAELLALPPRIRDKRLLDVQRSVDLSIRVIDFGLDVLEGTDLALVDLRVGELIAATGYEPGTWHGSLPEVEEIAARRAAAQAALEEALLDDDERARREAEAKELRDAFNAMRVKLSSDGSSLVAYTADGNVLDAAAMTPVQRKAFERANAIEATREAARRAPRLLQQHGAVTG